MPARKTPTRLDFHLHPGQLEVFQDPSRFQVVAAGRRWGKTYLASVKLLTEVLKTHLWDHNRNKKSLLGTEVWYTAPTYDQAKDIFWDDFLKLADAVIDQVWVNDGKIRFKNGRQLQIKGSDRPDRMRGVGLSYVVIDEYASMKPFVWERILRPTLADVQGGALMIGTPERKNHFYDVWDRAAKLEGWSQYHYLSEENPHLPAAEIELNRSEMSSETFRQEFEASFESGSGMFLNYPLKVVDDIPRDCQHYIAMDPAGFITEREARSARHRVDQAAIALVGVNRDGWFVENVDMGHWGVREACTRLLRHVQQFRPIAVGIEKGILDRAMRPYLEEEMRRLRIHANLVKVDHRGENKQSRILYAMQGRLERGRVFFKDGPYLRELRDQILDFPNARHDDGLDALSYIDQLSTVIYMEDWLQDTWSPLDEAIGV